LANFAIAFLIVLAGIAGLFTALTRRHTRANLAAPTAVHEPGEPS
jgi:hypothetical protein